MKRKFVKMIRIFRQFRPVRLKIAEQILIVLFGAVIIPMIVSSIVINNINQHAIRAQLRNSAILIANVVSEEVDVFINSANYQILQLSESLKFFPTGTSSTTYLNQIAKKFSIYQDLKIINKNDFNKEYDENRKLEKYTISTPLENSDNLLIATFLIKDLQKHLFNSLHDDMREIYVLDNENKLIASFNYTETVFNQTMALLPEKLKENEPIVFGNIKNQPIIYLKRTSPDILIIVNTTESMMQRTINVSREKLLLAILVSAIAIFVMVSFYVYYLYINIRQLFKGIIAMSKGSYERQIRLLKNVFTPYEIVFLAFEFNKMASEINKAYRNLQNSNEELAKLNEFRSNLIDTVSHELRTPLTSIQGYTSRLLRQDIVIDEETKLKSLRTIKRQSERLKRMIEDLLVIPDIERSRINIEIEPVWLSDIVEMSTMLVPQNSNKTITNNIDKDFPRIMADKDRLEQIIVNILENAIKYANDDSEIIISADYDEKNAKISISNECNKIPEDKLQSLFEKFTRMDDKTTRTTRGTGLGLFIVKGLVEAMNGTIKLSSTDEVGFCVDVTFPIDETQEL